LFCIAIISSGFGTNDMSKVKIKTKPKPNIIYFFVDDCGYGYLGGYGKKEIQRPAIAKMAKDGMRFT